MQRFTASGVFLGAWGGPGRGPGRFFTPTSIATDSGGYVYAAGARVQKFTADGQFVTEWGEIPARHGARPRLFSAVGQRTTKHSAFFRFSSPQDGARFQCRLSGGLVAAKQRAWRSCSSPWRYSRLRSGRKVFTCGRCGAPEKAEARHTWLIIG